MEQVTFLIENKKDANLLIAIADKPGIKKLEISKTLGKEKQKDLFQIIDAGVDISNFGDPSSWQSETRKDRTLN